MKIGIDISQIVHEGTGVAHYVKEMVRTLLTIDKTNDYILLGSSFRRRHVFTEYFNTVQYLSKKARLVVMPVAPFLLDILWNRLHVVSIEWFIGEVDIFWSSDWTQPPLTQARGITTIHDVSFLRCPETFAKTIIDVQKRRLAWVKCECTAILCDSEATKRDVMDLMGMPENKLHVVYPGFS